MFSFYLIALHYFLFNHLLSQSSPSLCILNSFSFFIWLFNIRQFIISFTLYTSILIFQSNLTLSAIFTLLLLLPLSLSLSLSFSFIFYFYFYFISFLLFLSETRLLLLVYFFQKILWTCVRGPSKREGCLQSSLPRANTF